MEDITQKDLSMTVLPEPTTHRETITRTRNQVDALSPPSKEKGGQAGGVNNHTPNKIGHETGAALESSAGGRFQVHRRSVMA